MKAFFAEPSFFQLLIKLPALALGIAGCQLLSSLRQLHMPVESAIRGGVHPHKPFSPAARHVALSHCISKAILPSPAFPIYNF